MALLLESNINRSEKLRAQYDNLFHPAENGIQNGSSRPGKVAHTKRVICIHLGAIPTGLRFLAQTIWPIELPKVQVSDVLSTPISSSGDGPNGSPGNLFNSQSYQRFLNGLSLTSNPVQNIGMGQSVPIGSPAIISDPYAQWLRQRQSSSLQQFQGIGYSERLAGPQQLSNGWTSANMLPGNAMMPPQRIYESMIPLADLGIGLDHSILAVNTASPSSSARVFNIGPIQNFPQTG